MVSIKYCEKCEMDTPHTEKKLKTMMNVKQKLYAMSRFSCIFCGSTFDTCTIRMGTGK